MPATKASIFGFPLHPMFVVVALGALPACVGLDVAYVATGDPGWYRAGFLVTLVGASALLASMVPGYVDYFTSVPRRGEVWKHASVHQVLGLALVGYFLVAALARWLTYPDPGAAAGWSALFMNAAGVAGLAVQAWVGRGLVLRHYVGVERDYVPELPPTHPEADPARDREVARRAREEHST